MMKTAVLIPALIAAVSLSGCGKDKSPSGVVLSSTELQSERIQMQPATLAECANGGTSLTTYIDLNANSVLDAGEKVLATSVICAGANGSNGNDGANGKDGTDGSKGTDGKDGVDGTNGKDGVDGKDGANGSDGKDGINGTDGKDGSNGADGKDGVDGTNGKDGVDGKDGTNGIDGTNGVDGHSPYTIVFSIKPEAPSCKNGGSTITFALDVNANGILDEEDQHTQSAEICNGASAPVEANFTCSAKVKSSSVWKEGYVVDISITYSGPARSGWNAAFTLPEEQEIVDIWNASPSAKKGNIVASSYPYNEKLEDGSTLTFGFKVLRTDHSIISGSAFALNGVACK